MRASWGFTSCSAAAVFSLGDAGCCWLEMQAGSTRGQGRCPGVRSGPRPHAGGRWRAPSGHCSSEAVPTAAVSPSSVQPANVGCPHTGGLHRGRSRGAERQVDADGRCGEGCRTGLPRSPLGFAQKGRPPRGGWGPIGDDGACAPPERHAVGRTKPQGRRRLDARSASRCVARARAPADGLSSRRKGSERKGEGGTEPRSPR